MGSHLPPRGANPAVDSYAARFKTRYGYSPTAVSYYVYSALSLLDEAFRSGARTPEAVKKRLISRGRMETPLLSFSLDAMGDADASLFLISDIAGEF
jgi:hypothetical protein